MKTLALHGRLAVVAITCGCLFLSACTTMQSVAIPGQSSQPLAVRVGDSVEVQTIQGRTVTFEITQIDSTALIGKAERVNFQDIAGLQVKRVDKARTGVAIVTVGLVAGLLVLLSNGIAFMPAGPS